MQVLPTPEGGIDKSKIVQKSFGVMIGVWVPPKAWLGAEAAIGTIRVGLRCEDGRVPPGGQERPREESEREEMISKGKGEEKAIVKMIGRRASDFIMRGGWRRDWLACYKCSDMFLLNEGED